MKNAKRSITRLKTKLLESLPQGGDIYGYQGINSTILAECLDETYGLLSSLEEKGDSFEVIFLKRKLSDLIGDSNDILKSMSSSLMKEKRFNSLLNNIFEIRNYVKETYLLVVQNALRNESELQRVKEELSEYKTLIEEHSELKSKFIDSKNNIDSITDEIISFHDSYSNSNSFVTEVCNNVTEKNDSITTIYNDAHDSITLISEAKENLLSYEGQFSSLTKNTRSELENLQKHNSNIDELYQYVEELKKNIDSKSSEIEAILADANRVSMASSFLKRKDELIKPIKNSAIIMNISLVCICAISFYLLHISGFGNEDFNYRSFLMKLPVIAPFIWIAWSNSQRNNYLVRIQEDYAFKAASAMAFEGYNKQVQDVDEALQMKLLSLSIDNMGSNPIRLFDKKVKNSPSSEVSDFASNISKTLFTPRENTKNKENKESNE